MGRRGDQGWQPREHNAQDGREQVWSPILSMVIGAAGVWLLLSPTVLSFSDAGLDTGAWNDRIIGPTVVVVTLLRVMWPTEQVVFSAVNAVIGCWLVVASYVLGYDDAPGAARNQVGVGLVILVLAITAAALSRRTRRPHDARH